jgi:hypothetical protein
MKPGQIDLFTKRVRKAPDALERELHIAVADHIRWAIRPDVIWFHPANGELRSDSTGALLKRRGVRPGVSDLLFAAPPQARLHALELKRRGKRPTPEQTAFLDAVRAIGGVSAWADSYDKAIELLKAWDILSDRLHIA